MHAAQRIAAFAAGFNNALLTEAQRHQACRALLDTVAVAIAGRNEATVRIAEDYARTLGSGSGTGVATGMAKSFQAGQCNAAAVRAALLAQKGFTANAHALDGKYGYLALYAANEDLAPALATLGEAPLEIEATGIDIKKYPCCYAIHRALDALFALKREHGLTTAQIEHVAVINSAGGLEALILRKPVSGLEAKFNMEYNMAVALIDGAVRLASFDDAQLQRADVQALMSRVSLGEAAGAILPRWSDVSITLKSGNTLQRRVSVARGDAGDPLSDAELTGKVADCFAFGQFGSDAQAFSKRVLDMSGTPLTEVIHVLHKAP